jgi:hypothetical protein
MATLTVTSISRAGVAANPTAATSGAGGDEFANDGHTFIEVVNGGGGSITVTLDIKVTVDGNAVTDRTVTVAAGARKRIGPFPTAFYNDPTTGRAKVTFSGVTSVTVEAIQP